MEKEKMRAEEFLGKLDQLRDSLAEWKEIEKRIYRCKEEVVKPIQTYRIRIETSRGDALNVSGYTNREAEKSFNMYIGPIFEQLLTLAQAHISQQEEKLESEIIKMLHRGTANAEK